MENTVLKPNPLSEESIHGLATALTHIDMELLEMGDSYSEIVDNLCYDAGIEFDSDCADEDEYYYKKKSIEAYQVIMKEKPENYIENIIDYIDAYMDTLRTAMVYTKSNSVDIMEHPTVKAICILDDYVQNINDESICCKKHCAKMSQIKEEISSIDMELCYVGNALGHMFFRTLNPNYYFHSNNCFVVGHILGKDDIEFKLGQYTIHAEIYSELRNNGHVQGYTIAFNRKDGSIVAHIHRFTKYFNPFSMTHEDSGVELVVDCENLEHFAKDLADKINELTENDFPKCANLENRQQNESVARRRGR